MGSDNADTSCEPAKLRRTHPTTNTKALVRRFALIKVASVLLFEYAMVSPGPVTARVHPIMAKWDEAAFNKLDERNNEGHAWWGMGIAIKKQARHSA
jgi:hypothetical protein